MCACIVCTCVCVCACIHAHARVCECACMRAYVCAHVRVSVCVCARTCGLARVSVRALQGCVLEGVCVYFICKCVRVIEGVCLRVCTVLYVRSCVFYVHMCVHGRMFLLACVFLCLCMLAISRQACCILHVCKPWCPVILQEIWYQV